MIEDNNESVTTPNVIKENVYNPVEPKYEHIGLSKSHRNKAASNEVASVGIKQEKTTYSEMVSREKSSLSTHSFDPYQKRGYHYSARFTLTNTNYISSKIDVTKDSATLNIAQWRFFSSKKESKQWHLDNCTHVLSSILENKEFKSELRSLLLSLEKSFSYKLEFYLFLNTNDETKKLIHLPKHDFILKFDEYCEQTTFNYFLGLMLLENTYKYKGHYLVYHDFFNQDLVQDFDVFVKHIIKILGEYAVHTNKTLDIDEFVEFKKLTGLKITKINKSNNSNSYEMRG